MINTDNFQPDKEYFAAANSHTGFISKFDKVFKRESYKRVFILKGGPGTGKSTILKGLCSLGRKNKLQAEAIYCSSDPHSLDGVILYNNDLRIAVLDGTSPHAEEAVCPGAIDELVDLGSGFNTRLLEEQREVILRASSLKKQAYKKAYDTLAEAAELFELILKEVKLFDIYSLADEIAEENLSDISDARGEQSESEIFYTAFGKNGLFTLPPRTDKRIINIGGDSLFSRLVLSKIKEKLKEKSIKSTSFSSPLDRRICDRVETGSCVYLCDRSSPETIDTSGISISDYPLLYKLFDCYLALLDKAKAYFKEASMYHFELEDIYKGAVDFGNNDEIFSSLCSRIEGYLL